MAYEKLDLVARQWLDTMPESLQKAVKITIEVTQRDFIVFLRVYKGANYLLFSTIPPHLHETVSQVSVAGTTLNIFLDYWADTHNRLDLIANAREYMLQGRPILHPELEHLPFLWEYYNQRVQEAPLIERYRPLLLREWANLFEAMRYSVLVNTDPTLPLSYETSLQKMGANMHYSILSMAEICFSERWEEAWTAQAEELTRIGQSITRISNWLQSWEQELIMHKDITAGVFAVALAHGVVSRAEVQAADSQAIIDRIASTPIPALNNLTAPNFLLAEGQRLLQELYQLNDLPFIDTQRYHDGMGQVLKELSLTLIEKR